MKKRSGQDSNSIHSGLKPKMKTNEYKSQNKNIQGNERPIQLTFSKQWRNKLKKTQEGRETLYAHDLVGFT